MTVPRHMIWAVGLIVLVLALDWITKRWVMDGLMAGLPQSLEVTGFFNIVWVWNRGVSFGMFGDGAIPPWGLKLLAGGIVTGLCVWLWRADTWPTALGLALIIGGAVGNMIDRALWGAVFDFLDFHAGGVHFPAFNLADSAITVGVGFLLFESLFVKSSPPTAEDKS